ncbi:MAG: BrnT family toxin [Chlorobiaceae bacterium]|nr:BrnT family toxin [Chlorobiaceae bacterium]
MFTNGSTSRRILRTDILLSSNEQRFRAVGRTIKKRHLFVVFTLRNNGKSLLIRPISARYMHKMEIQAHEKEIP